MIKTLKRFSRFELSKESLEAMTYYEMLDVKQNSSKAEIRRAYLSLARKYHPDLQKDPSVRFT